MSQAQAPACARRGQPGISSRSRQFFYGVSPITAGTPRRLSGPGFLLVRVTSFQPALGLGRAMGLARLAHGVVPRFGGPRVERSALWWPARGRSAHGRYPQWAAVLAFLVQHCDRFSAPAAANPAWTVRRTSTRGTHHAIKKEE